MPPRSETRQARRVPASTARDPRLLRPRQGGGRAQRTWRARLVAGARVAMLALALAGSGWFVQRVMTSSDAFAVRDVRVIGLARLSEGEVTGLLDGLRGRNIVTTALEPWRDRLLASPWVREASLRRALPDTIEVRITERVPLALARAGDRLWLVDELGLVVDEFGPRYATLDLPLVEGLMPQAEAPPDPARVALLVVATADLREAGLLDRVSQIDLAVPRNVAITLVDDPTVLQVGRDRFAERVQAWMDMRGRLTRMVSAMETVDLRFDNRVYVRPREAGVTFASMPQEDPAGAPVEEALAEPGDDDGQQ